MPEVFLIDRNREQSADKQKSNCCMFVTKTGITSHRPDASESWCNITFSTQFPARSLLYQYLWLKIECVTEIRFRWILFETCVSRRNANHGLKYFFHIEVHTYVCCLWYCRVPPVLATNNSIEKEYVLIALRKCTAMLLSEFEENTRVGAICNL